MDLKTTQLKDTYGNLLTIGTTAGSPQTGTIENGDGEDITSLTIAGDITASKNQNATSSFTFQNTDTTGTNVRTHLNATAGNRSVRLEAIHSDYSYLVSNNARLYLQTNSGSNNPLYLDGDNVIFNGQLGIGVTSPSYALDVTGDIALSNDLYISNGNFIKLQRNSGGLYLDVLGTPSGTDDVRLLTSGAFDLVNGSLTSMLKVDSSGNVGIGSSPAFSSGSGLEIERAGIATLRLQDTSTGKSTEITQGTNFEIDTVNTGMDIILDATTDTIFEIANSEIARINSTGLGIGVTPATTLDVASGNSGGDPAQDAPTLRITNTTQGNDWDIDDVVGTLEYYASDTSGNAPYVTSFIKSVNEQNNGTLPSGALTFGTATYNASGGAVERLRIDSSGNVLVGTTDTAPGVADTNVGVSLNSGRVFASAEGDYALNLNRNTSDGDIVRFRKDGTTVGSIASRGGTTTAFITNPSSGNGAGLTGSTNMLIPSSETGVAVDNRINLGSGSARFKDIYLGGSAYANGFYQNGSVTDNLVISQGTGTSKPSVALWGNDHASFPGQVHIVSNSSNADANSGEIRFYDYTGSAFQTNMTIDKSGNVLVGKTTADDFSSAGAQIESGGQITTSVAGAPSLRLNRGTDDGDIIELNRGGTTVGQIGAIAGLLTLGSSNNVALTFTSSAIRPSNNDGSGRDNAIDLGQSGNRFQDIYATNGTIQTSDVNEKQDIEELNDSELRVAQQAKTLLKKYRWKSSVEEKGDDARIHFGIIAQDLEQAFIDEGLDAGRYGMFIKSTWTNEDGEEQTRLGVRYNQLLAFIISSI